MSKKREKPPPSQTSSPEKTSEAGQEKRRPYSPFHEVDPVRPDIIRQNVAAYPASYASVDAGLAADAFFRSIPEEMALIRDILRPWESEDRRRRLALGLRDAVRSFWERVEDGDDPLAGIDEPLEESEAVAAVAWADLEARTNRAALLDESIDAVEAGRRTNRTRQAVERQRRDGRVLALREGRQWRYPAWQFDADGPGGLLPGLPEVIDKLRMSPAAAALWLSSPRPQLDDDVPIERLRRRDIEPVIALAESQGHWP